LTTVSFFFSSRFTLTSRFNFFVIQVFFFWLLCGHQRPVCEQLVHVAAQGEREAAAHAGHLLWRHPPAATASEAEGQAEPLEHLKNGFYPKN
jgi:hypothetical protein